MPDFTFCVYLLFRAKLYGKGQTSFASVWRLWKKLFAGGKVAYFVLKIDHFVYFEGFQNIESSTLIFTEKSFLLAKSI